MPRVSVILPVYNAAAYLKEAIDSVLAQTFTDFELIIINDGSTDGSEQIIKGYSDRRIKYFKNEENRGLIFTLNNAIDKAEGSFIARMDADDICLPERLEEQVKWLQNRPATDIVASFSDEMDETGKKIGYFEKDRKTATAKQIRNKMPVYNCLTHPTVMGRAQIFKQYKYSFTQPNIEDYDLWLRLLADGKVIEKVPKVLLLYRVHQSSVTQTKLRRTNFFLKRFWCKQRFLAQRRKQGKFNAFDFHVTIEMGFDVLKGIGKNGKRFLLRK